MSLTLLFVSALAGYWLLTHTNATKFRVLRPAGYALVLESAIAGLILFAFARVILVVIGDGFSDYQEAITKTVLPFEYSVAI